MQLASACALLVPGAGAAQTWTDFYVNARTLEKVSPVRRDAEFEFEDTRQFQQNTIPMELFTEVFGDSSAVRGYDGVTEESVLRALDVKVSVAYLGFYQTGAGRWSGKATLEVSVKDPNQVLQPKSFPITTDIILERGSLSAQRQAQWSQMVIGSAVNRLLDRLDATALEGGSAFRHVSVFGKVPGRTRTPETLKAATLDALREGAARAWGLQVEATTEMVDLADVTETTRSTGRGLILHHELDEAQTRITDDGFVVVLVNAIIANPSNQRSGR